MSMLKRKRTSLRASRSIASSMPAAATVSTSEARRDALATTVRAAFRP